MFGALVGYLAKGRCFYRDVREYDALKKYRKREQQRKLTLLQQWQVVKETLQPGLFQPVECHGRCYTLKDINNLVPTHVKALNLMDTLAHSVGLLQGGVSLYLAHVGDTAGEDLSRQAGMLEAGYPTVEAVLCAFGRHLLVFGCRGEQVDVAEVVVRRVERVGTVKERLHLPAHLVIVDGRCEDDCVGVVHLVHHGGRIVTNDATQGLGAGKAASAEPQVFAAEGDGLHLVARLLCAARKLLSQRVRVALRSQTGSDNQYFHIL